MSDAEMRRRTAAMRALSDADRRAAIECSPNVIGFGRFAGDGGPRIRRGDR